MKKLLMVAMTLLLVACNTLSIANYDKLKLGMSYEEITAILGKSDSCDEQLATRRCQWGDDNKQIRVTFVANRATFFSHKGLN